MRFALISALMLLLAFAVPARAQQVADTTFVPTVERPAFTEHHPIVMIDEAHHNYFTMNGLYRAFATLLREDGLRVLAGVQRFSKPLLGNCQVLVVAGALGAPGPENPDARRPAFLSSECDAVRDWVREGGALLLIADPSPFATAMDSLALHLGVDMGKGYTLDTRRTDPESGNVGCILYTRDREMLGDHPITRGRDDGERISRVVTFTGQSLQGPPGSTGLLVLSPSAADIPFTSDARREADPRMAAKANVPDELKEGGAVPALGRFQGLAFQLGKGRVVVLGDGAMFGTQRVYGPDAQRMEKDFLRLGLNRPDLDNQQLALNILHWLTGLLD